MLQAPALERVASLIVQVGAPIEAGDVQGVGYAGKRRIIPILGGRVTGQINGAIAPGGADFQRIASPTLAVLDARYLITLDDGSGSVFVQNRALRRGSAQDIAKLARGEPVDPSAIYFRCVPSFETSAPHLHWLTEHIFVGTGARFPDRVELAIFCVR